MLFVLFCISFVVKAQIANDQISGDTAEVFQTETPAIIINGDVLLTGEHLSYKVKILLESGETSTQGKISSLLLRTSAIKILMRTT